MSTLKTVLSTHPHRPPAHSTPAMLRADCSPYYRERNKALRVTNLKLASLKNWLCVLCSVLFSYVPIRIVGDGSPPPLKAWRRGRRRRCMVAPLRIRPSPRPAWCQTPLSGSRSSRDPRYHNRRRNGTASRWPCPSPRAGKSWAWCSSTLR